MLRLMIRHVPPGTGRSTALAERRQIISGGGSQSSQLITPTRTPVESTTNKLWTRSDNRFSMTRAAGVSGVTEKTTGVIRSRTGVGSLSRRDSRVGSVGHSSWRAKAATERTRSWIWMRMSEWLTTPTGCPAASITGAAANLLAVNNATTSSTVAVSRIEIGLGALSPLPSLRAGLPAWLLKWSWSSSFGQQAVGLPDQIEFSKRAVGDNNKADANAMPKSVVYTINFEMRE